MANSRYPYDVNSFYDNALERRSIIRDIPVTITRGYNYTPSTTNIPIEVFDNTPIRTTGGDCKFLPQLPLEQYKLNDDPNPDVIRKKPIEPVRYRQDVAVRFLEPPVAPKPGDIVVRQLPNRQIAPAPPLIVRQAPQKPVTPAPLVIREAPPQPPQKISEQLILVPGRVLPPPARKVVIERLPPIPPKPQQIFIEKWLPFKKQKRRVVFQKADADCVLPNPRNLIIQWEAPEVQVTRDYKNLGIQHADPEDYVNRHGRELLRHDEFMSRVRTTGAPDSLIETNSHQDVGLPDLEGDIEALRLVDLERSGLTQYRSYLNGLGIRSVQITAGEYGLVTSQESRNLISVDEAKQIADNLNAGTERLFTESDLRAYFNSLDSSVDAYEEYRTESF